jgi:HNH endonuclease
MAGVRGLTLAERFWMKVDKDGPTPEWEPALGPCWLWTAATLKDGYGAFKQASGRSGGRQRKAHVVSWELAHGAVPEGLQLDHLCRVRHCIRPDHLEPVTGGENLLRSPITLNAVNAAKTHCPQGHEYAAGNTHVDKRGRRHCLTCAREKQAARAVGGESCSSQDCPSTAHTAGLCRKHYMQQWRARQTN